MKKKRRTKKSSIPIYKRAYVLSLTMIVLVVITIVLMIKFNKNKKPANVNIGNKETIIKDSSQSYEYHVNGDFVSGDKYEAKQKIDIKTQNPLISKQEYSKNKCDSLMKKRDELIMQLEKIKDETAMEVIKEQIEKIETEFNSKCK
ncbi:MAG: hypothetical protein H8D45_27555 [Bacteroidetes bacterium]|nr:hypothetical protein [Bacteroidota bacterium]